MYRSTQPLRHGVRPSLSSSSVPVLPRRNVQETVWSGIQGLWSLMVSEDKRQAYLDLAHPGWNHPLFVAFLGQMYSEVFR